MKKLLLRFSVNRFLRTSLEKTATLHTDVKLLAYVPLHLITIAFNNPEVLGYQHQLVKKNITDQYVQVIADNSSDPAQRKMIREFCRENGLTYIPLPCNPYAGASSSHAAAMKWMCANYLSVVRPAYFGFIDHDIYPVRPHSIIAHLSGQGIYGHLQERDPYWYLWPGLCFFSAAHIRSEDLNFDPCVRNGIALDTGGSNWNLLYAQMDRSTIRFPDHSYLSLREGEVAQSDKLELIGEWLHSFNGSYWMEVQPKEQELRRYLEQHYL